AALFGPLRLDVPGGKWTCLLGRSGVGKSTILRLFAGLETGAALAGRFGADDGATLAGRVAWMAQDDLLLPWLDVAGNVALGALLRGAAAEPGRLAATIARVGLTEHAGKRPGALSGGQRQRAALARTLMEDRPVVLLDEPFSALDAALRAEMQDLAAEVLEGRTVLMVTHDPGEAVRLGHHVHVLTGAGLAPVDLPAGAPPRPVDDPRVLAAQAHLLARLRGAT
ncbi:MAG: ABC transporter ATP-binding protein, partial [Alphaproteobacteria bacterium HGW-Alphaproteobacteria-2]